MSGSMFSAIDAGQVGPTARQTIANSTIANNRYGISSAANVELELDGVVLANAIANCANAAIVSRGHNIASDATCALDDTTDRSDLDPLLGELAENGGDTWTHALLPGSPAIDAIPAADCVYDDDSDPNTPDVPLARDQRGVSRPQGENCDIGAYEAVPEPDASSLGLAALVALAGTRGLRRIRRSRGLPWRGESEPSRTLAFRGWPPAESASAACDRSRAAATVGVERAA